MPGVVRAAHAWGWRARGTTAAAFRAAAAVLPAAGSAAAGSTAAAFGLVDDAAQQLAERGGAPDVLDARVTRAVDFDGALRLLKCRLELSLELRAASRPCVGFRRYQTPRRVQNQAARSDRRGAARGFVCGGGGAEQSSGSRERTAGEWGWEGVGKGFIVGRASAGGGCSFELQTPIPRES